ncbi:BrnA antitoxin family protein [Pseudomonas xanthosomatis]|uniref:BrnA antitoxin family protein n=1 Tax=Pseudomonas TaxID=286 RepID=UPI001C3CF500|nr:BrnA antitoxin family protein [Pseudomonas xanthosomatis]QXH45590.1 BrnA antitoxin family protein [Pseudomonas xanthosomatis]
MPKPSADDDRNLPVNDQVDTSDIPELDDDFFERAELRLPAKQTVTIRLDSDVLAWFKAQGAGYQTRINQLLRQYMEARQRR